MAMHDAERTQMQRNHVFCVDGSSVFLNFVRLLLEAEQYNVTTTNFVPETFDQIEAVTPDLLIVDLEVGKRAGWELLEVLECEAVTKSIPVLVVSTDEQLLRRLNQERERYGIDMSLAKPFDIDAMLNAVQRLVGEA